MHKEGATYLAPVSQRENKISSVRKWDQAFCMYATFYCGANPARAREIWQYVDVIHTTAASYAWDNVYNYDVTFRHLMEFNPTRSWAVTYNQMWNLSLKDPISRNGFMSNKFAPHSNNFGNAESNQSNNQNLRGSNSKQQFRKKSDYCWNWNKGVPCKFSPKCKFIERCSYCDSGAHGILMCPKLENKTKQEKLAAAKTTTPMSVSPAN